MKDETDTKIRGVLQLANVRMEYSLPECYVYPKVLPQYSQPTSLNTNATDPENKSGQNFNQNNMFSIRLIINMKFTEMYT